MKNATRNSQRRDFLRAGTALVAASAAALVTAPAHAQAGKLEEKDAQAVALGYRNDGSKVDQAKYPKHAASQVCGNCQVYQGKAGDASGACPIFAGKQVSAKGWCSAWVKKA